jgi:hypothetical protein
MGEAKRRGGPRFDKGELERLGAGTALSGAMLRLGGFPSGDLHFFGPDPDIVAATAGVAAVAVWGQPLLSWTMPLDEFEHELRARDGQCVVLDDFDAASPEQVRAVLAAINKASVAVVSWGVGSVCALVGFDEAIDVVVDIPVPRLAAST